MAGTRRRQDDDPPHRMRKLHPLLFVSSHFYRETRNLMYCSPSIRLALYSGLKLLQTLAMSPHLGEEVTSLYLDTSVIGGALTRANCQFEEIASWIERGLKNMPSLTSLRIEQHYSSPSSFFLPLVNGCPFRLTSFKLDLRLVDPEVVPGVWEWIQTQGDITSFTFTSRLQCLEIGSHVLPNLEYLDAPYEVAVNLLKTGPRPHLRALTAARPENSPPVLPWTNAGSIQTLLLSGVYLPHIIGPKTIPFFHNLVELKIIIVPKTDLGWVRLSSLS